MHLSLEEAERNDQQKIAEQQASAAEASALEVEQQQAAMEADKKRREEAEQKAQAKQAAEAAAKKMEEVNNEKKRLAEAVAGVSAGDCNAEEGKRRKIDEARETVATLASLQVDVVVSNGQLILVNTSATNKKVPADTILVSWCEGSSLNTKRETGFEYKMTFKEDIVGKEIGKRIKLDKYIKEYCQGVSEIFGYEPFPSGSIPKMLVKKSSSKIHRWDYTGSDKEMVERAIEAARNCPVVSPLWQVRYVAARKRVEPNGLTLVLMKSQQVPGGGELVLQ